VVTANGVFVTVLVYMTEFGVATEATTRWNEIGVTVEQADRFGLTVLAIGVVMLVVGLLLRKATGERWHRA